MWDRAFGTFCRGEPESIDGVFVMCGVDDLEMPEEEM